MGRMQDKVVVMTGADGGICFSASEIFAREGAKVVMIDKDPSVKDKAAEIVAKGGDVIAIVADVSKKEAWNEILKTTIDKYGRVDCCINGAAEFTNTGDWNSPSMDMKEWDLVLETNLKSMLWSYQVILQYMIDNQIKGNFINFSSATALSYVGSGCSAYPMSKAAITTTTNSMVSPNGKYGIRFNMLAPNCIWTPKQDGVFKQYGDWMKTLVPLDRLGMPDEVANVLLFLASDEAKYVNGVNIPVDGGWYTCH